MTILMNYALIRYTARSDKGCVRKNNEDNIFFCGRYLTHYELNYPFHADGECHSPTIFGVFDGVGGEQYGECASMIAAQILTHYEAQFLSNFDIKLSGKMDSYATDVNHKIGKTALVQGSRMGTTAAIVIISRDKISAYNIGDSRIYTCVHGRLKQISVDHTLAREKINLNRYTTKEAKLSSDWGKLTACLGIPGSNGEFSKITQLPIIPVKETMRLLLCSDGITDMVPDNVIEAILSFGRPNYAGKKLMSEVLNRGGRDNSSFIIVDVIPKGVQISSLRYSLPI